MEQEQVQQQGEQNQGQGQPDLNQAIQQMQAMMHQLAADQQAMWHHVQTIQAQAYAQPHAHPTQQEASEQRVSGPPPQAESCEHHNVNPQEQAEHFMRMADKFSRGDVSMTDVAGGLSYLNTQSSSLWKGLLIGGGLTLLVSNDSIRESIVGLFKKESGNDSK